MKIYLDYIFFINFIFDLLLLLSVSIILRRNVSIKRIILGALFGGISIFTLFVKINSLELFLLKLLISIIMTLITFKYKNIKYTLKNISYLYMSSMILGGVLYFLNIEFSYKQEGLIFYNNGFSINLIVLVILSPIIIYIYIKQAFNLKLNYSNYYKVKIKYKNKELNLNAFLDTGNKLKDPITKIPVVMVEESNFKNIDKYLYVPCHTISGSSIIKCIIPDEFKIDGINKKVLLGLSKNIKIDGIDCILNPILLEEK